MFVFKVEVFVLEVVHVHFMHEYPWIQISVEHLYLESKLMDLPDKWYSIIQTWGEDKASYPVTQACWEVMCDPLSSSVFKEESQWGQQKILRVPGVSVSVSQKLTTLANVNKFYNLL